MKKNNKTDELIYKDGTGGIGGGRRGRYRNCHCEAEQSLENEMNEFLHIRQKRHF